jgi:spore germination protein KB
MMASRGSRDMWLSFIIAFLYGLVFLIIYITISRLNGYMSLITILRNCFGNIFGSIISLLYIWYFIHLAALIFRDFGDYFLIVVYTETPILFTIISISFVVVYALRKGLKVIGRISEVFCILLSIVIIFVFFSFFKEYDTSSLKPFFAQGFKPIIKNAYNMFAFPFGETVVFLMIFPYIYSKKKMINYSVVGLTVFGLIMLSIILRNLMVLDVDMLSRDVYPSHVVYRIIPIMDLDPLLDTTYIMSGIIKISICIFAATTGIAQLFNLNDYKPFILPTTALIVSISIWVYSNVIEMLQFNEYIWPIYSTPFQVIIPIILLIISFIRKKKENINSSKIEDNNNN